MIQTQTQKMEKNQLAIFLQGSNVEFEVESSTIKIEGIVKYISTAGSVKEIAIFHDNKIVVFDEYMEINRLLVSNGSELKCIYLSKNVSVHYSYPYLIIHL